MEVKQKPRGRPKGKNDAQQRDLIVHAARELFVQRGYGSTKTDDIAAHCKISKQTLYRLFPCKSALFAAVVESYQQQWLDLPRADDDLSLCDALLQIFKIDISEEADRERTGLIRLVMVEEHGNPELTTIVKTHGLAISCSALADWLECQQHRGRIGSCDSRWLAQVLIDMIFGAVIVKPFQDVTWPTGDARRQHIRGCVGVFLNGVAVDVGK